MKSKITSFAAAFMAMAAVSCTTQSNLPEPFTGAKWIGTQQDVLYADYLAQFVIFADMDFTHGASRASILFGANDPRLMDANMNIMGVANGPDESFVRVELDTKGKCVNVYRTGYTPQDTPGKVFQSLEVADSLLQERPVKLSVRVSYSELAVSVAGEDIGQIDVGPLGHGGDFIAYPQLADLGYYVEPGQMSRVSDIQVREINKPNKLLYHNTGMTEAQADCFALYEPSFGGMPVLRSSFKLKDKTIESAKLYATARGIYEVSINGRKVGGDYLAPGLSQYNKHHYYQTYDVTEMLTKGRNSIRTMLGEGWWSGDLTYGGGNRNYFGDQLAFLAALEVKYADGSIQRIVTDPREWEATTDGSVRYASLFQGQVTDARLDDESAEWTKASEMTLEGHISDNTFGANAPRTDEYDAWQLLPQLDPSPSCFATLTAQSVEEVRPGVFVYDMGQNFAGIPSVSLKGLKQGQKLRFRYAEVLYPQLPEYKGNEGMIMLENLRGAMVQDIYTASGAPMELFEPHFTQHGYRYMEISGMDRALALEDVKGIVISSVQEVSAHYECSNPLVNRLWQNIKWSMLANFISIPTDCPQRNERMGWSGDLSVFGRTATYISDVDEFLRRHMVAIRDVQLPDGRMPDVAPIGGAFGGLLWGSAGITIPYEAYRQYADVEILEQNYEAMDRYMELVADKYVEQETGLMTQGNRFFGGLGDWLGPQNAQLDNTSIWDAYYIFDLQIMAEVSKVLGKAHDEAKYAQRLAQRKEEFVTRYLDPQTGKFIATDYPRGNIAGGGAMKSSPGDIIDIQSSYVLPLAFDIIQDKTLKAKVLDNLVEAIKHPGITDSGIACPPYSLMTGFITTAWISKALSDNGRSDMAYRLLQAKTYPSWLYPVTQGATTIWERLDSYTNERGFGGNNSMNSFNHYSFGAVGQWMMAYSLGIDRDPQQPGFKHFVLHPQADPTGEMTWAKGWYDTPYGRICSGWKREGAYIAYSFTIPEGCSATLDIPGVQPQELCAGEHSFKTIARF